MPQDFGSLIEECTNGTTKASLYLSRLGLQKSFKNPTKPGRPAFKSIPAIHCFQVATLREVKAIATRYKSRNAIREALRIRRICLDEIARDCLESHGHEIWNNGLKAPFVTSVDAATDLSKTSKAGDTSRVKKSSGINVHAKFAEGTYPRHLIYEDLSDQRKIRLQVSAWIIQRACLKAENDRRKENTPRKASRKASTKSSSFIEAVHVNRLKRTRSTSLSSNDSVDELDFDHPANSSRQCNRIEYSNTAHQPRPQSSRKAHDTLQTPAKRRTNQSVAVVVSPRKPESTKATGMASRKRKRSEPLGKGNTVPWSAQGKRKEVPRGKTQLHTPCRTTPRRMGIGTRGERPVKGGADANLELLARQLDHDRDDLGIQLPDLLAPYNPGCHDLADIKRTTGLIDTIALNDIEGLRKALGNAHDKHKIALDRWLGCVKTLVEFREITGLEGDEDIIEASFQSLPLHIRKKARPLRQRKRQEILNWFKKPRFTKSGFTIPGFAEEVASMLLKMTSWGGLDMDLKELLDDMTPFTARLLEWFRAVPPDSTTSVNKP